MRIFAIETSCDDTSMAIVDVIDPKKRGEPAFFNVVKNIVSSQTDIHRHWGGVVPNLAKREHLKNLPILYEKIFSSLRGGQSTSQSHPDLIAVTVGPGLEPSLWTGIEFAKKISEELSVPLVGANHLEGHLYSNLISDSFKQNADNNKKITFPAIVLLVSGGHTMLVLMKSLRFWIKLGETRDDAVGEAFDKVAKMTGLPYPGGPEIEKLARLGNPESIKFPRPMIGEKNYEFSFSGLKTAVLYHLRDNKTKIEDIAASFQAAAIDVLVKKTMRASLEFGAKSIFLCGGVAANKALRAALQKSAKEINADFFAPDSEYNSDNAAMIAVAAYMRQQSRKKKYSLEASSNLSL